MMFSSRTLQRQSSANLPLAFTAVFFLSIPGLAQQTPRISAGSVVGGARGPSVAGCPNNSGILDSISVPVNNPITLRVVIFVPAPPGGAIFQLASENPAIAAAGDPKQAFLPQVTIPAGQMQSNTFQVFGIAVGQTALDIIPLTPGFSPSSTPLGAWDVNPPSSQKFLDANPPTKSCRTPGTGNLSTDPATQATCGTPVQGAAADGVTNLLLRTVSGLPGTACYEIVSQSSFDQGAVQTPLATTSAPNGPLNYAFSYYQAPANYGDTSPSRTVTVQFTFTPNIGNGNTTSIQSQATIVRPPILLVHGLWSDSNTWSGDFIRNDAFHTTFAANYMGTNDASFTTNVPNFGGSNGFVAQTLSAARGKNYAVTQVDVLGHSMGGVLSRLWAASAQYNRPENFNKGDFRRLVTLDTPHWGSNFANLLVSLHRVDATDTESTVRNIIGAAARVTQGGVCDLSENSPALAVLGATSLPGRPITATGGPPGTPTSPALFWGGALGMLHVHSFEAALTATRCVQRNILHICTQTAPVFPQATVDAFRFREMNDAVVPLSGQQGGLTSTNFPNLLHFAASVVSGVTNTAAVATLAFSLLDGPASSLAASWPAANSNGSGNPRTVPGRGNGLDAADFANQCSAGGPMKQNAKAPPPGTLTVSGDSRVQVTSPANGQTFAPGDTLNISVTSSVPANDTGVDLVGLAHVDGVNYDGTSYQASYAIPDFYAGPLTINPVITDTLNNLITGVGVTVDVRPSTPPTSISLSNHNFFLGAPPSNPSGLTVTGFYPNDVQRDLTSSASGTTYQSSNTSVITVDTEGNFQSVSVGTAVVAVRNSGAMDFATFVVEDPQNPLPPQDLTGEATIQKSGFRLNRSNGFFLQDVTVTNVQSVPLVGPLFLVLSGLSNGVNLVNASGLTVNISPSSSPYLSLPLADGLTLQPGAGVTFHLEFLNPGRASISYTSSLVRANLP